MAIQEFENFARWRKNSITQCAIAEIKRSQTSSLFQPVAKPLEGSFVDNSKRRDLPEGLKVTSWDTMHIKTIIIENFKSYHGRHVVQNLHSENNVIVGRNGAGKSNFFEAIAFVLTDDYIPLTEQRRKSVICDIGGNPYTLVEIILDNSDRRLPLNANEVRMQRKVTVPGRDSIHINNTPHTQRELKEFLKFTFSTRNPYYIVRQDRVMSLAWASDSRILEIAAEAAGVQDPPNCEELLQAVEEKKRQLERKLRVLANRLETVEREREEYRNWKKSEKELRLMRRRLLEISIVEERKKLDDFRLGFEEKLAEVEELSPAFLDAANAHRRLQEELTELERALELLRTRRDRLRADHAELTANLGVLKSKEQKLKDEICGRENLREETYEEKVARVVAKRAELEATLAERSAQLNDLWSQLERSVKELVAARHGIYAATNVIRILRGLRNRTISVVDVKAEIEAMNEEVQSQERKKLNYREELADTAGKIEEIEAELVKTQGVLRDEKIRLGTARKCLEEADVQRHKLVEQRKERQRSVSAAHQVLEEKQQQLSAVNRKLSREVSADYFRGMYSVRQILETFKKQNKLDLVENYKGYVLDQFELRGSEMRTAVEAAGGTRLFHHVVTDLRTAKAIMDERKRQKLGGHVEIIPLAEVLPPFRGAYPADPRARPLVDYLHIKEGRNSAVNFVFGSTMIVENIAVGLEMAEDSSLPPLNYVTLRGELVMGPGRLRGGWRDPERSKIALYTDRVCLEEERNAAKEDLDRELGLVHRVQDELTRTLTSIEKTKLDIARSEGAVERGEKSVMHLHAQLGLQRELLERTREVFEDLQADVDAKANIKRILHDAAMTTAANVDIETIEVQISELTDTVGNLQEQRRSLLDRKRKLELEVERLRMDLDHLVGEEARLEEHHGVSSDDRLASLRGEISQCGAAAASIEEELREVEHRVRALDAEICDRRTEIETTEQGMARAETDLAKRLEELDELDADAKRVEGEVLRLEAELENVGPISTSHNAEAFQEISKRQLKRNIDETSRNMKSFDEFNHSALEQLEELERHHHAARRALEKQERAVASVTRALRDLKQLKYETLRVSFEEIQQNFREIFQNIVPNGEADLEPVSNGKGFNGDVDWSEVDGIRVVTTFAGDEVGDMHQLSGGQKTVVALAFVFAIQRYSPAPFYLFDEIDKALDPVYRGAVAQVIYELSRDSQFIAITFRKEMLENAARFFKVYSLKGKSHIEVCEWEEAESFLTTE